MKQAKEVESQKCKYEPNIIYTINRILFLKTVTENDEIR